MSKDCIQKENYVNTDTSIPYCEFKGECRGQDYTMCITLKRIPVQGEILEGMANTLYAGEAPRCSIVDLDLKKALNLARKNNEKNHRIELSDKI